MVEIREESSEPYNGDGPSSSTAGSGSTGNEGNAQRRVTLSVKSVLDRLSSATGLPSVQLSVILCGRVLEESTPLQDLFLGPATSLVALVVDHKQPTSPSSPTTPNTPQIGSFYLWCKPCADITRGKLRVKCSECSGSAVVVKSEPQGWNDVLKSNRIRASCADCGDHETHAVFYFKCVGCSEIGAPLSQIRGNWDHSSCVICAEEAGVFVFDLGCNHPVCRDCFEHHVSKSLSDGRFTFRVPFGYTVACPACDYYVKDPHHFYVMGLEKYRQYQQMATEKLVALDEQGVFCPYRGCGGCFFWEPEKEETKAMCPKCTREFCLNCKSETCSCGEEDPTTNTIAATTRKCPGCQVSTEHSGGCMHMHCTSCGVHWCFRCVKPWSDDCQWDHWFA